MKRIWGIFAVTSMCDFSGLVGKFSDDCSLPLFVCWMFMLVSSTVVVVGGSG